MTKALGAWIEQKYSQTCLAPARDGTVATLLPSDLSAAAQAGADDGEIATLRLLAKELPKAYRIYHSVHWSRFDRATSAHGEIDFAIINRSGNVLVIEQKNGPLEETAQGLSKRYRNGAKPLNSQIERNTWNLIDRFSERVGGTRKLAIEHLIYCPDHHIVAINAPGIDRSRTIDARNKGKLIERIEELLGPGVNHADNWTELIYEFFGQTFRVMPDVSSYVSSQKRVYAQMREGLTDAVGKLEFSPYRLRVIGTAGCGKSQLALAFCQHEVARSRRTLMLCFNRPLADKLNTLAPRGATVDTYYGFCKRTLETLNPDVRIEPTQEPGFWRHVQEQLMGVDIPENSLFDALIVDEGQDFKQEWWEIMRLFLKPKASVLWVEDPSQNLRDSDEVLLEDFVVYRENANFRSPMSIGKFIRAALGIEFHQKNRLPGLGVNLETYSDPAELRKKLAHQISELVRQGFGHEEIVIISCRGLGSTSLNGCDTLGAITLRRFTQRYTSDGEQIYTDGKIYFDTIYRFKGQQTPAVILIDIDESLENTDQARRVLYCAMTRATVHLKLMVHVSSPWKSALEAAA